MGLDHERRSQSPVPRPLGTLLVPGGGPVELSPSKALGGIERHDIDYSDVKPKSPPTRFQNEIQSVLLLSFRSDRLLDQHLAPNAILDPACQPSDDTVVATDDVAPLFALARMDPPVVERTTTPSRP